MKKFLVSLLAIALSLVFFTASGCAPSVPLAFNNDFNGGGGSSAEPTSLTETLFYEVKYTDNYSDTIIKDENITDDLLSEIFDDDNPKPKKKNKTVKTEKTEKAPKSKKPTKKRLK